MIDPPRTFRSQRGAPTSRTLLVNAGVLSLRPGARGAAAFTTQPVDPATINNRLADPDELADKMSNGQSGGTTFGMPGGLPGGVKLQFSGPSSSNTPNSPIVEFPSRVLVPSKHR